MSLHSAQPMLHKQTNKKILKNNNSFPPLASTSPHYSQAVIQSPQSYCRTFFRIIPTWQQLPVISFSSFRNWMIASLCQSDLRLSSCLSPSNSTCYFSKYQIFFRSSIFKVLVISVFTFLMEKYTLQSIIQ